MKKFVGLFLLVSSLHSYPLSFRGVDIDAELRQDPAVERPAILTVYIDVKNNTSSSFWIEPHYSSYLQSGWRKYYREVVASGAGFKSGLLAPGETRAGYVYFKPETKQDLQFVINGMKLDDSTPAFDLRWEFNNPEVASAEAKAMANLPKGKQNLSYNDQLLVLSSDKNQLNLQALKFDTPDEIGRGQRLPINVYLPTGLAGEEVIVVLSVSDSVRLNKARDGVFSGALPISELYTPGTYTLTVYVRTTDKRTGTVQKNIQIK